MVEISMLSIWVLIIKKSLLRQEFIVSFWHLCESKPGSLLLFVSSLLLWIFTTEPWFSIISEVFCSNIMLKCMRPFKYTKWNKYISVQIVTYKYTEIQESLERLSKIGQVLIKTTISFSKEGSILNGRKQYRIHIVFKMDPKIQISY